MDVVIDEVSANVSDGLFDVVSEELSVVATDEVSTGVSDKTAGSALDEIFSKTFVHQEDAAPLQNGAVFHHIPACSACCKITFNII